MVTSAVNGVGERSRDAARRWPILPRWVTSVRVLLTVIAQPRR